jgi:ABC-type multidrug transport system fused ATPase/permease subunit
MRPFWKYASRMTRYPATMLGAMSLALLSAGSLGAGLVGLKPILELVIGGKDSPPAGDFAAVVARWNTALERWGVQVPAWVVEALPPGPMTAPILLFSVLGVLTVIGAAANFGHVFLSLTVVNKTLSDIRRDVFDRVLRLPLLEVVKVGPTDVVNRIIVDSWNLSTGFATLLSKAVADSTKGLVAVIVAFVMDWRISIVAMVAAPLIAMVIRKTGSRIRRATRRVLEHQADVSRTALESLQGFRVVKVHTTEGRQVTAFDTSNRKFLRELNKVRTARALASPVVEVIAIVAVGVMTLVAIKAIFDGNLDKETMIVVLGALGMAGASMRPLTGLFNDIQQSSAAADRLWELESAHPEPGHPTSGVNLPEMPPHGASVEFDGVRLTYPGAGAAALDGVSLTVRHGETVAFVGPNGCGKTTLLSLIPRIFDPASGTVRIDGEDIRKFSVESLRRQIGVVTQETVLFHGTIGENIAYGMEGATRDEVEAAAKRARAHEFIVNKPGGYDEPVAEQGLSMSGGQRQRLAIARAILRDPKILILDEATSMIDAESEARIAEALAEFKRGRTCLVVAHRLSTVLAADRIVVMDKGTIVDVGRHGELLDRCPLYRSLAENQGLGGVNSQMANGQVAT